MGRLLVLCPPALRVGLAAGLAAAGRDAEVAALPPADGPRGDPYRLRGRLGPLTADAGAKAALVVAPRRRGPMRAVPGAVVDGVMVGLVQADRGTDLDPWLTGLASTRRRGEVHGGDTEAQLAGLAAKRTVGQAPADLLVTAMGKDVYLDIAGGWLRTLESAGVPAADLRADRADRRRLCAALAAGPAVVLYAGHGRARGWAGYQGLRVHHLDAPADAPAGAVIAMACGTLSRTRAAVPFGSRLVAAGRVLAYVGAVGAITVEGGRRLGELLVAALASGRHPTLADATTAAARSADGTAAAVLGRLRLVGDPLQPLPALPTDSARNWASRGVAKSTNPLAR